MKWIRQDLSETGSGAEGKCNKLGNVPCTPWQCTVGMRRQSELDIRLSRDGQEESLVQGASPVWVLAWISSKQQWSCLPPRVEMTGSNYLRELFYLYWKAINKLGCSVKIDFYFPKIKCFNRNMQCWHLYLPSTLVFFHGVHESFGGIAQW